MADPLINHDEILPALPPAVPHELAALTTTTTTTTPASTGAAAPTGTVKSADPFLVAFAHPHDASNPLDWPTSRKWLATDVLSATGFCRILVSTVMAPALPLVAADLRMTPAEAALALSVYLLATALGPLLAAPLSEVRGRRAVLHASGVWFLAWNLACGFAASKGVLITARLMAGLGASAVYALGGGVLGDVWRPEERGVSLGVYMLIPLLGAAVGPIIGGFIVARTTWRWIFWSTSAFQAVMTVVSFYSFHETYGLLILRRRAERLRRETGDQRYRTASERLEGDRSTATVLTRALTRPVRLLVFHPIIQVSAVLSGFNYGILYIVLSTFSQLWTARYNQSVEISGLHYIACSLGELAGSQVGGPLMDYLYRRQLSQNPNPESRLLLMFPSIVIAVVGILSYGWAAEYRLPWPIVDLGVFVLMFGMQSGGMPTTAYVIDSYRDHTSSAMAAQQFVKSLFAFLFPLFAPRMYNVLGYGWANTILAAVSLVLAIPLSLFLYKYGPRLRAKTISTY